ncbi:MAG: 30S ribosome-binding factor RbfA [Gammaproteobacteria bacterium]|nr:30S ribosome-binding factor RbfA [Gammaproteobacteria bacterium]
MPREYGRNKRVADLVQRELAGIIQHEQTDTGVELVTISYVDVSPDLKNAKIYITSMDVNRTREDITETLNSFAGHFRYLLAQQLTLKVVPKLKFIYDESIERGTHLNALLDSLVKSDDS